MNYVDTATLRHAGQRHSPGMGVTNCGRVVKIVASGACIAPMIECERCKATLRKHGWLV